MFTKHWEEGVKRQDRKVRPEPCLPTNRSLFRERTNWHRVVKEVITVGLIQYDSYLYSKGNLDIGIETAKKQGGHLKTREAWNKSFFLWASEGNRPTPGSWSSPCTPETRTPAVKGHSLWHLKVAARSQALSLSSSWQVNVCDWTNTESMQLSPQGHLSQCLQGIPEPQTSLQL